MQYHLNYQLVDRITISDVYVAIIKRYIFQTLEDISSSSFMYVMHAYCRGFQSPNNPCIWLVICEAAQKRQILRNEYKELYQLIAHHFQHKI